MTCLDLGRAMGDLVEDDGEAPLVKPTRPKKPQSLNCRLRDVVDPDRIAEHTLAFIVDIVCIAERM